MYAKNVKNWEFFEERYATKQDWLAWFYNSKNNIIDHRSYADVVWTIPPSTGKSAQFHSNFQLNFQYQKSISPRVIVQNTITSLPKSNSDFELHLKNRFIPLQDLDLEPFESNHTTASQPSMVTHSTLLNSPRVSHRNLCKKNDLKYNCDYNLSIQPSHQPLNHDHSIPSECKQEKIPPDLSMNRMNCVDYVNCSQQNGK